MNTTITECPVVPEIQQPVAPAPVVRPARDRIGELLERSADYIDRHGWTQNAYNNSLGQVCAMGAVETLLYGSTSALIPSSGRKQEFRRIFALLRASRRIRKTLGLSRWDTVPCSNHKLLLKHIPSGLIPVLGNGIAVIEWNDKRSTTQQDVVRGLREAAAKH